MHNKNNNKSKKLIQGLRPFSSAIPRTLKKYLRKNGYNFSNIVDNWTKIVNKKISDVCYPASVRMGKEMKNGTILLNVIHGKELEVEYQKKEIIDKLNNFFGYNCIEQVKLQIVRDKVFDKKPFLNKIKDLPELNRKIEKVNNDNLRKSLNNFLKAYNEKNN